jgi:hypothetical protein
MGTGSNGRERSEVDWTRRGFLRTGGFGAVATALASARALAADRSVDDRAVILLLLVGGPSQLETWDPKPDAPAEIRGPFGSIATRVPGVRVCEHLPRLAQRLDRLALIRSLNHDAAPIHETGYQLIQTGRLCRLGQEHPHAGSVAARLLGGRHAAPPFVIIPGPIDNTGVAVSHGQTPGLLGPEYAPFAPARDDDRSHIAGTRARPPAAEPAVRRVLNIAHESDRVRDAYGRTPFGDDCLRARRLVEAGTRLVTVNMFETVFNRVSWDCHGAQPFCTLQDYANEVLPTFDRAFAALIDDLASRGLLESTLVVATGEFGRTPRLNASGGRDHWPDVWSAALAGGGTSGGTVIGASDAHASVPSDRPVSPAELLATIYRHLRIDPAQTMSLRDGSTLSLAGGAQPIAEAFA